MVQIVPGQLEVFGTSGDHVMVHTLSGVKTILRADVPGLGDVGPGDHVPGYIYPDGSYHTDPQG